MIDQRQQYCTTMCGYTTYIYIFTHIVVYNKNTFGCSKHAGQFSFIIGRQFFVAKSAVNVSLVWGLYHLYQLCGDWFLIQCVVGISLYVIPDVG